MQHAPTQFSEPWQTWPEPQQINDLPDDGKEIEEKPF